MEQEQRLLSTEEFADQVGVPPATVAKWRHLGIGPVGYRIGKHVRYAPADVDRWLAERTRRAGPRRDPDATNPRRQPGARSDAFQHVRRRR